MNKNEYRLRIVIALGWCMMFFLMLAMIIADLLKSAIVNDFSDWRDHLGVNGLLITTVLMLVYAFMPMLVLAISAKWFRGIVVGITVLITLFVVAHEISHLLAKDTSFSMRHALDFGHHILGIWVTVVASRWAIITESTDNN